MITSLIRKAIDSACVQLMLPLAEYTVEPTTDLMNGDWATNVALKLAPGSRGQGKQLPLAIAHAIVRKLGRVAFAERIEVAAPGFINIFLSQKWIKKELKKICAGDWADLGHLGRGKRVLIEYVSANPTGPLHIGNARSGPLGSSLGRVLHLAGFTVSYEYYVNDIGGQVERLGSSLLSRIQGHDLPPDGMEYRGAFYEELSAFLTQVLVKEYGQDGMRTLAQEKLLQFVRKKAIELNLASIAKDSCDLGCRFDRFVYESTIAKDKTAAVVAQLKKSGATREKDGALWLAGISGEDRESVLVKSDGSYTYFANDIAYHLDKFERGYDAVINVWGSNHHGHVSRMQAGLSALGIPSDRLNIILYQYVRVKHGKQVVRMSKRLGTFVTAREVLDEVGVDATRFFLLSRSANTPLDFDLALAKQHSDTNPVYAVQYAHARICSILRKIDNEDTKAGRYLLHHPSERALACKLIEFPPLLAQIAKALSVHLLTYYARDLSSLFHQFYEQCRVLTDNEEESSARVLLVRATQRVLAQALDVLGVRAPAKMDKRVEHY